MKLIIAIIAEDDVKEVTKKLNEQKIQFTRLSTSGGFLKKGNVTLLIGSEKPDEVIELLKELCKKREEYVPIMLDSLSPMVAPIEVGGATIFVLDVEKYVKV